MAAPGRPVSRLHALPRRAGVLVAALVLTLVLAPPASSAAGAPTLINFDAEGLNGALLTSQYEAQGLKMGFAKDFGQPAPSEGKFDCGPPRVEAQNGGLEAASAPNWATLQACPGGGTPLKGTYGALAKGPTSTLSVKVSNVTPAGGPGVEMDLVGYNSAGQEVASGHGEAISGKWQVISLLVSGEPQISFFAVHAAKANAALVAIDDLSFESKAAGGGGGGGAPGGGSPPTPPSTSIALQSPNPGPGQLLTLSGAGSQPGSGRIISYDWDFNGDGRIDTSTGSNPIAHLILAPGVHTVGLTVTNSGGQRSSSRFSVTIPSLQPAIPPPDGGQGPCLTTLEEGDARILGECIQKLEDGYVIETRQLGLNGMTLVPHGGGYGIFKVKTEKDIAIAGSKTVLSGSTVDIELLNTPIGDVVLGSRDLESEPMQLNAHSGLGGGLKVPINHRLRARARAAEAPTKTLLAAFGVGHTCSSSESKKAGCCPPAHSNTACATLPGDFPLTGQVVVYLNNKGQALIDVQVGLELKAVNFEATGALEIEADLETGINLSSLKFAIPEASLASIFKVKEASFVYYFPDYTEESKRDTWQAKGTITFGPLEQPGLEAELAFKKGQFHSASMVFTAPAGAGVPIYPGIELNKLGGSVGVEPLSFGGTLGASIATQLELTLSFKFREATSTELGFFGGQGVLSYKDDEIATLAADVYSDGYVDAKLAIDLHFPFDSDSPVVKVGGNIGFWDEPSSGLWQAEGNVYLKLWEISAEVGGLINNQYIAGCAEAASFGVQGRYRLSDGNIGGGFFGLSNCSDQLKQYQQKPLVTHSGGFVGEGERSPVAVAAASEQTFTLPPGQAGEELRLSSTAGTPLLTLVGPKGETYATPAAGGHLVTTGDRFIAGVAPDPHQVLVFLRRPAGGTWQVRTAPGSPALTSLETAVDEPPAKLTVRVHHGRGHSFSLDYRIINLVSGLHVRLVERGRDSTHVLGTVGRASGTLRFTPQDAISRSRRIVAYLLNSEGAPQRVLTAGHYLAPAAQRPSRTGRVRITRRGVNALVSWGAALRARSYAVRVKGSDGRLLSLSVGARHHAVLVRNVLPFQSLSVSVRARGGPNLLAGPAARGGLPAVRRRRGSGSRH